MRPSLLKVKLPEEGRVSQTAVSPPFSDRVHVDALPRGTDLWQSKVQ